MKPLVYDYGGLNTDTERAYIERIVQNHVRIVILSHSICNRFYTDPMAIEMQFLCAPCIGKKE